MKEFTVTLTAISKKNFNLRASTQEEASMLVEAIMENSDLLDFTDEDVDNVEVDCEEVCGGVCETCGNACECCGDYTDLPTNCSYPDKDCEYRCPVCGGCMYDGEDD